MPIDAVIPVGGRVVADRLNLRYTLRSIQANLRWVRDVWIVGDVPDWIADTAGTIRMPPVSPKCEDVRRKVTAAANCELIAPTVLLMCDDQYVMRPITSADHLPVYHAGDTFQRLDRLADGRGRWGQTVRATAEWVRDQGADTASYALHQPMLYDRRKLARALDDYPAGRPLDVAGLYTIAGVLLPGVRGKNAKVRGDDDLDGKRGMPWLSSTDGETFTGSALGKLVAATFPGKSRWET